MSKVAVDLASTEDGGGPDMTLSSRDIVLVFFESGGPTSAEAGYGIEVEEFEARRHCSIRFLISGFEGG